MKRRAVALLVGFAGVASCTIIALSDDIHQERCGWELGTITYSDDCDALNDRNNADFDPCRHWRCGKDHYCEIGLEDQDRDGYAPESCLPAGTPGDCADRDPKSFPNAKEVCDGKDNDCDNAIDEGMLHVEERVAMSFDAAIGNFAFAWYDVTSDVGIAYRRANDNAVGFGIATTGSVNGIGQPVWPSDGNDVFHASAVGIAAKSGNFLLSMVEAAPSHRIYVGDVASAPGRAIVTIGDVNHEQTGLRCAADESCAAAQGPRLENTADPGSLPPAPMIPESTAPQLAVLGTQVLAAYARTLSPAADGCDVTTPEPPLLLNLLEPQIAGYSELSPDANRLAVGGELRSPRLLAIDSKLLIGSHPPFGYLASYSDTDGALVVRQVLPQPSDVLADLQLRLTPDSGPYLEAQMVRGPVEPDRIVIGVAARAGCGDNARVVFGVLQLTWDAEERNELRVFRELQEVGSPGQQAQRPVLAYNRSLSTWAIAWVSNDGVYARVLGANGQPVGDAPYRITDTLPAVPDMAVVSGPSSSDPVMFTVYTYEERPDESESHVLVARELRTCGVESATSRPRGP